MTTDSALRELVDDVAYKLRVAADNPSAHGGQPGLIVVMNEQAGRLESILTAAGEAHEGAVPWRREWEGSGPQRGFHIVEAVRLTNNKRIAYLGWEIDGREVDAIIDAHNAGAKPIECRFGCPELQVCDFCQSRRTDAAAQAAPAGMVLVPREPTREQKIAGQFGITTSAAGAIYKAMLAAAPIAPPPSLNEAFDQVGAAMRREVRGEGAPAAQVAEPVRLAPMCHAVIRDEDVVAAYYHASQGKEAEQFAKARGWECESLFAGSAIDYIVDQRVKAAAQVADEGALEHWDSIISDAEEIASNSRDERIKYRAERVAGYLRSHKPGVVN